MKARVLEEAINAKSLSRFGRIIVLTGARQTGKTTLALRCFPEYRYISIEDPVTRGTYAGLTSEQWMAEYPKAILDEVQKAPSLIESIKSVYDQHKEPAYILLGSSQFLLLERVRESLAGRCSIFDILPLTLPEMMTSSWDDKITPSFFQHYLHDNELPRIPSFTIHSAHAKAMKTFMHYLDFGGYPAIAMDDVDDNERREWLSDYIRTFLERDIRDLVELRSLEPFVKLQQAAALLTGTIVNHSGLAREADVSSSTARRYMQYLELSDQIIMLQPWTRNKLKRLRQSPKLHFLDSGIHRAILQKQGMMSGNEFESAVSAEIYKQVKTGNLNARLHYLRTSDGREVDMLVETENGYIAIEIKMTRNVSRTDARHLTGLDDILDKPLIHSFVLSNDPQIKSPGENITAMPAAMFLT
jgi:uncharacterized protein